MNKEEFSGQRVRLVSFLGGANAPSDVRASENYWLLIGSSGTVICNGEGVFGSSGKEKYLVKFERDVKGLGLHCHNEISNALWIQAKDVEFIL